MRPSSSPSTPPSSASKSPYVSFFDLEGKLGLFQCGCTSDVQFPTEHDEESVCDATQRERRHQPQHSVVSYYEDEVDFSLDEEEAPESAKDYVDRITKELAAKEERNLKSSWPTSKASNRSTTVSEDSTGLSTVFRMATSSTSTINNTPSQFPSLKHSDSQSTQSTEALSDDELSLASQDNEEEAPKDTKPAIVSILRRKEKLGEVHIAATGSAVRFCPTTVFPDPSKKPRKCKRVRRLPKPARCAPIVIPCESYESHCYSDELRRLERRAQQQQHSYLSFDVRSPSSDVLLSTESFYVFR